MNATSKSLNRPRSKWLLVAVLPIAILAVGIGYIALNEWRASRELQRRIAEIRDAGGPIDRTSMKLWYERNSHPEGLTEWREILQMLGWWADYDRLPVQGTRQLPVVIDPSVPWDDLEVVEKYVQSMAPVREAIQQAVELPTPVQFPLDFRGTWTYLSDHQESRSVNRFLTLDFEYAYYTGDKKRAMEDLRLMSQVPKAFECDLFMVCRFTTIGLYGLRDECIARSLVKNQWSEEELNEIRDMLGDNPYSLERMKRLCQNERAVHLNAALGGEDHESLQGFGSPFLTALITPSQQLRFFEYWDSLEQLLEVPVHEMAKEGERRESLAINSGKLGVMSIYVPAVASYVSAEVRNENDRKWRLTAVGLRLFKMKHDRWPTKLSELAEVGVVAGDYTMINGSPFGYEVADGIAYLWTGKDGKDEKPSPTRPTREPSLPEDPEFDVHELMELQ